MRILLSAFMIFLIASGCKETEKQLYMPKTMPSIIDVPQVTYITVEGKDDPNTSA